MNAALIAKDGSLTERISHLYRKSIEELSSTRTKSKPQILHWTAIYRMVERCAYSLSRSLMKQFVDVR